MSKKIHSLFFLIFTLVFIFGLIINARAREDYFRPAIGEALINSVGSEQAVLSEDGSLSLMSGDGKILPGWPLNVDNVMLVGSPLLIDMNGDGVSEVVVFGRDVNNIYTLFVYDGAKKLLASTVLGSESYYYDTVALPLKNQLVRDLLISAQSGKVLKIHLNGSQLTSIILLDVSKPVAVAVNNNGTELVLAYPDNKVLDIYAWDGAKIILTKKITLNSEIIYPVSYNTDETIIYGVSRDNKLVAIEKNSGNILTGFPTMLSSAAVGSPLLVNLDTSSSSDEIVVNLSNGRKDVFDGLGNKLAIDLGVKSFGNQSLDIQNKTDNTLLSGLNNFVLQSVSSIKNLLSSFWSVIKINILSKIDLLDVDISANPSSGVPPMIVKLSATASGGAAKVSDRLNFSQLNLRNIVPTNATGSGESQDNGDTLYLNKMMWKAVDLPYTITPNTVVELDFKSNGLGWSHGFGFDNGYPVWNVKHYIPFSSVYGENINADNSFNDYVSLGQWKHYKIPVGKLLVNKAYSEMYFNSYCGNAYCPAVFDSYFRNVRIYESDKPNYSFAWDFGDGTTVTSSAGYDSIYHTYNNSGDYTAKVTVDDGQTQIVKTIPIKTAWATFDTLISASPSSGVPPLPVRLSATPFGGAALSSPLKVNFNSQTLKNFSSYPNQSGTSTVLDGGDTIGLVGFNFKTYDVNYTLTSSTMLEFDFKSNVYGWSHDIGFETPWTSGKRFFNLAGTANYTDWPINDFRNYNKQGQWQHYKIPVGQYYIVFASKLILDAYCSNAWCPTNFDSYFRNIRIYESDKSLYSYTWDFGDGSNASSSVGYDVMYHTYTTPGNFVAKVTVNDSQSLVSNSTTISVTP